MIMGAADCRRTIDAPAGPSPHLSSLHPVPCTPVLGIPPCCPYHFQDAGECALEREPTFSGAQNTFALDDCNLWGVINQTTTKVLVGLEGEWRACRRESNRKSARRSRARKLQEITDLKDQIQSLKAHLDQRERELNDCNEVVTSLQKQMRSMLQKRAQMA
jgi:hypothetical protein